MLSIKQCQQLNSYTNTDFFKQVQPTNMTFNYLKNNSITKNINLSHEKSIKAKSQLNTYYSKLF